MNPSSASPSLTDARKNLVDLAKKMLSGELSFFEGSARIVDLRYQLEVPARDKDFDIFLVIRSETDHLPLAAQQGILSELALVQLEKELAKTEEWARSFAESACRNLIARFGVMENED